MIYNVVIGRVVLCTRVYIIITFVGGHDDIYSWIIKKLIVVPETRFYKFKNYIKTYFAMSIRVEIWIRYVINVTQ